MKILLISTDCAQNEYRLKHNAYGGVTYYRLIAPQKACNALGHEFVYLGNNFTKIVPTEYGRLFAGFDAVISKHIDNPQGAKNIKVACEQNNIPMIYDLDDDLFSIRDDNPAHESYARGNMKRVYLATNLSFADAFFVSTEPLKETYQKYMKQLFDVTIPTYVLPNYNDAELFGDKYKVNEHKVMLGYHGSITHDSDLLMVLPVVDALMSKYPHLEMQLIGTVRRDSINKLFDGIKNKMRFEIKAGTPAFDKFPELLMSQRWDIGLAPLIDDVFNRGKSHIKYLEYSLKGIPTVASDVYPYTNNAKEAVLCKNVNEWKQKLENLIIDKKLRRETGQKAKQHVLAECQYKDHGHEWVEALTSVIKNYKK